MLKQNSYDSIQTSRSPTAHMNLGRGGCMSTHLLELVNSTEDRGNEKPYCAVKQGSIPTAKTSQSPLPGHCGQYQG